MFSDESKPPKTSTTPIGMPGATNFHECAPLVEKLKKQKQADKTVAAICASPAVVFAQYGLLGKGVCYLR